MRALFVTIAFLLTFSSFGQSDAEKDVLKLSKQIFDWEVTNAIDSLDDLVSNDFKVVTSRGEIQTKEQYLATLRSDNFKHDSITVEQQVITVTNNTATAIGKGMFHMTVSGNKLHRHLSYMEVFTKEKMKWKLLALYASVLPEQ